MAMGGEMLAMEGEMLAEETRATTPKPEEKEVTVLKREEGEVPPSNRKEAGTPHKGQLLKETENVEEVMIYINQMKISSSNKKLLNNQLKVVCPSPTTTFIKVK